MPSLFVLPKQVPLSSGGDLLAGSKLYFYQTATTTPQDTYTDIGLTIAHANPVVADANGVFAAIYFDPSLPHYRVKLTTSADVQLWQLDDIPSNQNTSQSFRLKSTAPELIFEETDASATNKKWRIRVNSEALTIDLGNDAESAWTNLLTLDRTGTTPDAMNFAGQYLKVNGNTVATIESGSFTATLTGMTASTTGTVKWRRTGTKITLSIASQIAGTSNTTAMSMTGLPAGLLAAVDSAFVTCLVRDNGATAIGTATVGTSSIVFSVGVGAFTNSGSKGLPAGTQIIYDTDQSGIA